MYDSAIVGGGLSGLVAAIRFAREGRNTILFDSGLPQSGGRLGGFAKFSGAKFSLLPAGQGLIPVAGSEQHLRDAIGEVLAVLGLRETDAVGSATEAISHATDLHVRSYSSIVLSPSQIDELLERCAVHLRSDVIAKSVVDIQRGASGFQLTDDSGAKHLASSVLYAAGRNTTSLLEALGAQPQAGKGLDLGLRLEFDDGVGLSGLRKLGPDAKILHESTRTFCLNVPGKIYRYPFENFSIPGGVVAEKGHLASNVGILVRQRHKADALARVRRVLSAVSKDEIEAAPAFEGGGLGPSEDLYIRAFGPEVASKIADFLGLLSERGLVDLTLPHRLHFPLIDWHWPVFALAASAATSARGVYVAGDSAGHARGLLQAAVSGWLAAQEIVSAGDAVL